MTASADTADVFRRQADACQALGSPFTARLLRLVAGALAPGTLVFDRILAWPGDISARGASVPLRLAGALHALVLKGADAGLTAAYPPHEADDAALHDAVARALDAHEGHVMHWLDSAPQTNEVGRSAALIAAGHWLARRHPLPFRLSELGCSAGLNLGWDHAALEGAGRAIGPAEASLRLTPEMRGTWPGAGEVLVTDRAGVDLYPLDIAQAEDRLRLMSYIWPDQPGRLARTRQAMSTAAALGPSIARGDAADWLEARLATARPGMLHMVFHTVAWQYFPLETQARCLAALEAAGERATADTPLARVAMENDGDLEGAALTLDLWPDGRHIRLGRVDFHGRWLDWRPDDA